MLNRVKFLLGSLCLLLGLYAHGIPKPKKEIKKILPVVPVSAPQVAKKKLNAQFGFNLLTETAIITGFQMGWLVAPKSEFYLGPELNFMLFSPGSVLNVLLGGWFENHWFRNSRKSIDLGLVLGCGFAAQQPQIKTTNLVALIDVAYSQIVDDSLSLRWQIRPGLIDRKILVALNFNAQFAFP